MHKKAARWIPLYSYLKVILHALNEVGCSCSKVYVIINFLKLNKILSYLLPEIFQPISIFFLHISFPKNGLISPMKEEELELMERTDILHVMDL